MIWLLDVPKQELWGSFESRAHAHEWARETKRKSYQLYTAAVARSAMRNFYINKPTESKDD